MHLRAAAKPNTITGEDQPRRWSASRRYTPMTRFLAAAIVAWLMMVFAAATLFLQSSGGTAQGSVELGADADPDGNSETSLGTADACVSVNTGNTFDIDIFVSDVDNLVHWELYFTFDPSIVDLIGADMRMFLYSAAGSSLKTQWDEIFPGRHFLGAADLRDAPESGSGVLARLTFEAKGPGTSDAKIFYLDFDDDGDDDFGPRLTDSDGAAVGDVTGDGVFDGPTHHALIAVDESCETATPTPTLPPSPTPPPGGGTAPSDPSPPPDLPVPGDPTLEPPADTSPPADDGSASENGQDSAPDGEPEDASEAGPGEEATEDADTDGAAEADRSDDSDDASAPAVLAAEGISTPSDPEGGSRPALGGDYLPPSSSDGGLPLWAIGSIAAAVLVAAAGTSVYLASRSGGRYGR